MQNQLREISAECGFILRAAENWHTNYKDDPTSFRQLLRAEAALEDSLKRYFKGLYSRLYKLIDFKEYRIRAIKAYDVVVKVDDSAFTDEIAIMLDFVVDDMKQAVSAGVAASIARYSPGYPFSSWDTEIAKAVNTLSMKDVTGIMENTRELMKASLQTSMNLNETDQQAMLRLKDYIDNDRRALTIARTESVRSYSAGTLAFGKVSGAQQKTWHIVTDACIICEQNDEETVNIDDLFSSGDDMPPAHPNCRCSMSLIFPDGSEGFD